MSVLDRLVAQAAADARDRESKVPLRRLRARLGDAPPVRPFTKALLGGSGLIAEVKRASPSRGAINPGLDPAQLAQAYARGGAACVSVLTDRVNFGGCLEDLVAARPALPTLRKDFLTTEYQLVEARAFGADAVLLIAAALPEARLVELAALARELGLEVLFEVHEAGELEEARAARPDLLGVNARNLKTLHVHPDAFARLAPLGHAIAPLVAESGIKTADDVHRYRKLGAAAVLVGEALSSATDPESATRALVGAG